MHCNFEVGSKETHPYCGSLGCHCDAVRLCKEALLYEYQIQQRCNESLLSCGASFVEVMSFGTLKNGILTVDERYLVG